MTRDAFEVWWHAQPKACVYCGIPDEKAVELYKHRLNVDRLDGKIGYVAGNICLACLPCNLVKSGFLTHQEMLDVGRRYMRPKWTGISFVNAHVGLLAACELALSFARGQHGTDALETVLMCAIARARGA